MEQQPGYEIELQKQTKNQPVDEATLAFYPMIMPQRIARPAMMSDDQIEPWKSANAVSDQYCLNRFELIWITEKAMNPHHRLRYGVAYMVLKNRFGTDNSVCFATLSCADSEKTTRVEDEDVPNVQSRLKLNNYVSVSNVIRIQLPKTREQNPEAYDVFAVAVHDEHLQNIIKRSHGMNEYPKKESAPSSKTVIVATDLYERELEKQRKFLPHDRETEEYYKIELKLRERSPKGALGTTTDAEIKTKILDSFAAKLTRPVPVWISRGLHRLRYGVVFQCNGPVGLCRVVLLKCQHHQQTNDPRSRLDYAHVMLSKTHTVKLPTSRGENETLYDLWSLAIRDNSVMNCLNDTAHRALASKTPSVEEQKPTSVRVSNTSNDAEVERLKKVAEEYSRMAAKSKTAATTTTTTTAANKKPEQQQQQQIRYATPQQLEKYQTESAAAVKQLNTGGELTAILKKTELTVTYTSDDTITEVVNAFFEKKAFKSTDFSDAVDVAKKAVDISKKMNFEAAASSPFKIRALEEVKNPDWISEQYNEFMARTGMVVIPGYEGLKFKHPSLTMEGKVIYGVCPALGVIHGSHMLVLLYKFDPEEFVKNTKEHTIEIVATTWLMNKCLKGTEFECTSMIVTSNKFTLTLFGHPSSDNCTALIDKLEEAVSQKTTAVYIHPVEFRTPTRKANLHYYY